MGIDLSNIDERSAVAPVGELAGGMAIEQRREALMEAVRAALSGELKGKFAQMQLPNIWKAKKLNPKHLLIALLKACGYKHKQIAAEVGMHPQQVYLVLRQPHTQQLLAELVSIQAESILDVPTRLKAHANEMVDIAIDVARNAPKPETRAKSAFKILEMAGYKAIERKEIAHSHRLEMPKHEAQRIAAALEESVELIGDEEEDYSQYLDAPVVDDGGELDEVEEVEFEVLAENDASPKHRLALPESVGVSRRTSRDADEPEESETGNLPPAQAGGRGEPPITGSPRAPSIQLRKQA